MSQDQEWVPGGGAGPQFPPGTGVFCPLALYLVWSLEDTEGTYSTYPALEGDQSSQGGMAGLSPRLLGDVWLREVFSARQASS